VPGEPNRKNVKRRRGRPRIAREARRAERVTLRLGREEIKALAFLVRKWRVSVGEVFRRCLLKQTESKDLERNGG